MTPEEIKGLPLDGLIAIGEFDCVCGTRHYAGTKHVVIEHGAIMKLPELLAEAGSRRPFLISGHDTFAAAGERVEEALDKAGLAYSSYVFPHSPVLPAEHAVGAAVMHFDDRCDAIIGIVSFVKDIPDYPEDTLKKYCDFSFDSAADIAALL